MLGNQRVGGVLAGKSTEQGGAGVIHGRAGSAEIRAGGLQGRAGGVEIRAGVIQGRAGGEDGGA